MVTPAAEAAAAARSATALAAREDEIETREPEAPPPKKPIRRTLPFGGDWSDYSPAPARVPSVPLYVTLLDRYREWRERVFPFSPSERVWNISGTWHRHWRALAGLIALVVVMLIAAGVALRLATAAPSRAVHLPLGASATAQPATGVIVHPPEGKSFATPGAFAYTAGVWLSDTSPEATGVVQVFVRVSNAGAPVAGCVTSVYVTYPDGGGQSLGVTRTDSYGLATFNLTLNNASTTRPITVKASAVVPTGSADATITFIARPVGSGSGTPSPSATPPAAAPPAETQPPVKPPHK